MKLLVVVVLISICTVSALASNEKKSKPEISKNDSKLKREAAISSGGSYHGPSYKYLPPSPSNLNSGFNSFSSGEHTALSGYGLRSPSFQGGHSSGPKVETYIVQTETALGDHGISHGFVGTQDFGGSHGSHGLSGGHGISHGHGSNDGIGYKYAGPTAPFSSGQGGYQSSFGNSYSHSQGPVHKIKAIVIPAHSFSSGGHDVHGHGGALGAQNGGYSYSKYFGAGSPYSNSFGGDYSNHNAANFGSGYKSHSHGSHSYSHGNDLTEHSYEPSYRDSDHESGHSSGYTYGTPSSSFSHSHGHSHASSNSYDNFNNILSPPYHSGGESAGQQVPAYAAGHKGLGHFGFTANKPQVLNTNFIDSNRYGANSYASQGQSEYSHSGSASKAPFKPSLFLGTSHEGSSSHSAGAISQDYAAPFGHSVSSQYLSPPTSDGYDYAPPPPPALYGAPSDSHSHVGSSNAINEPDTSYLPPSGPKTSYGTPAAPGDSYLPPHH